MKEAKPSSLPTCLYPQTIFPSTQNQPQTIEEYLPCFRPHS